MSETSREHAIRRAAERYDVELSCADLEELEERIKSKDAVLFYRSPRARHKTQWLVKWKDILFRVAYSSKTQHIATFLTMPNAPNEALFDLYVRMAAAQK